MGSKIMISTTGLFVVWSAHAQPRLEVLNDLAPDQYSVAVAVSRDGTVAAGMYSPPGGTTLHGFRWVAGQGMEDIAVPAIPGAVKVNVVAMSHDGTVISGMIEGSTSIFVPPFRPRAFRWSSSARVFEYLPALTGGEWSRWVYGISGDGGTIVGRGLELSTTTFHPLVWRSSAGSVGVEEFALGGSTLQGASGDGGVLVGSIEGRGFRWTASSVDYFDQASVCCSSENGQVVAGSNRDGHAFRWTRETGMTDLGALPGETSSYATAISPDGRVIVGRSRNRPFVWTKLRGMMDLNDVLPTLGLNPQGLFFDEVFDVADHGSAIVGCTGRSTNVFGFLISGLSWWCVADIDDGSMTGQDDDAVTIDDLVYYLQLFADGDQRADFDDGSFTGLFDGGVTIEDLLYFLYRFSVGC